MHLTTLSSWQVADMAIRYLHDPASGRVGLQWVPTALVERIAPRRETLRGLSYIDAVPDNRTLPPPAWVLEPLVQLKRVGDPYPGTFGHGHTMRNAPSNDAFRYHGQTVERCGMKTTILTTLQSTEGQRLEHRLSWHEGDAAVEVSTTFVNDGADPVTLEMISSFALGGLTPFDAADAPGRLRVHRFRSAWSAEGRHEVRSLESLHLERSWSGAGALSERFGQVGSMPVRRWFPFVAVEDTAAGVVWGAQLAWAGSWQLEVYRQHDDVCFSGGLADREFGHWLKTLAPGESLVTPPATLACARGDLDALCDRLTAVQHRAADAHPAVEHDLPIIFNEYCTTWGDPRHDQVAAIAARLKDSDVRYLVIDAGWYKNGQGDWSNAHGDWVPSAGLFPDGLEATAAAIRAHGLIPGLWFELETVGSVSAAFSLVDHLLRRDGVPITVRNRRFWDLNDPFVVDFLTERVVGLLERGGFGYLKVDYNETLGIGCDGAESLGEGLRRQVLGVYRFFECIRERLPHLVIENCSSGGHRLEPSMLARTAMASFSDAHELVEIPIIAAGLHRLMLPRQSQIWAVLHRADSEQRLVYSLAATFLGRMCLSGEFTELTLAQRALTREAQRVYRRAAPIIKHGTTRRYGEVGESWRHPRGWQAVVRVGAGGRGALVVLHAFEAAPAEIAVPLPAGDGWRIQETFAAGTTAPRTEGDQLVCPIVGDFSGQVVLLAR